MRGLLIVLALAFLAAALAAQAPATLLDRPVVDATRGRVRLADARGTVWTGSGALADASGRWTLPLAWRVDVASLLQRTPALALTGTPTAPARGHVTLDGSDVRADDLDVPLPAAALQAAWTRAPVPQLDGEIHVVSPALRWDGARLHGDGELRWERARIGFAGLALDLGTVAATAQERGDGSVIALSNRGGDLRLAGAISPTPDGATLAATLTPAAGLAPAIALMLSTLGTPDVNGAVRLSVQLKR